MKVASYASLALAVGLIAACGREAGITGPGDKDALLRDGSVLAVGVDPTTGATIETNKDDYSPGEVVHLVGRGWAAGETVNLHMTEEPKTHADVDTNVVADASGQFSIHFYDVQDHDAGVTFTLTATGSTSNSVAVAVFTDGDVRVRTNSPLFTVTITWESFTNAACSGTGTPGSTPNVDDDGNNTIINILASQSVRMTAPATAGGRNFTGWSGNISSTNQTICVTGSQNTQHWVASYNLAPTANAGGPYATTPEGTAVSLNGSASSDPEAGTLTYNWSYVAGAAVDAGATCSFSNASATPSVTCTDDGAYTIRLTVTDPQGVASSQATANLTISNVAPTATIGASPPSVNLGGAFTVSLTAPADAGTNDLGANLLYRFDCGGGYNAFSAANSRNCTATTSPTQTVKGQISDQDGGVTEYTLGVSVSSNAPPTVDAGSYSVAEGTELTLIPTVTDPDAGDILSYKWTINKTGIDTNGDCQFIDATVKNAKITCDDDSQGAPGGKFTLTLEVKDGAGGHTVTGDADLTVTNANPVANAGANKSGQEGGSISLSGSANDPGDNDDAGLTYLWSVNDNGIDPGGNCTVSNASSATLATVTCTDDGAFTVSLQVSDDDGGSHTATVNLSVSNVNPVANAGSGKLGAEGSAIALVGSGNDQGDNDDQDLTYLWSVDDTGIDAGGNCTVSNATSASLATVTCTDDGTFSVSLQVSDDDGGSHTASTSLTVSNANPVANAHGDYTGTEGGNVVLTGSKTDAGSNDTHTYKWTYTKGAGVHAGATCSFSNDAIASPTVVCTDNGAYTLTLTVTDDDNGSHADNAALTLGNATPVVTITGPADYSILPIGTINVTATYTDAGANDTHECEIFLDGVIDVTNAYSGVSGGNCAKGILPVEAGLYDLVVRIKDDDGDVGTATINIIVYDPSAGFVTGGGWIQSPAGAYVAAPTSSGKATFGFVSKYKRGATIPEGNTEFQYHAGALNFHSSNYQWLVVNQAGTNAQFKGTGSINGQGTYNFMIWATDNGNAGDTFRIQITTTAGAVVYDNGVEQTLGGGSIVIHTGGKK